LRGGGIEQSRPPVGLTFGGDCRHAGRFPSRSLIARLAQIDCRQKQKCMFVGLFALTEAQLAKRSFCADVQLCERHQEDSEGNIGGRKGQQRAAAVDEAVRKPLQHQRRSENS